MKNLIYFLPLCFAASLVHAAVIAEVPKIAGKNQEQVAKLLGKPGSCSKIKYGPKCDYKDGQIEIVFIKGKADWITIKGLEKLPFSEDTIKVIGFSPRAPEVAMPIVKRWENIQGLMEVSLFKGQIGSDYAYIKAYTP